MTPPLPQPGELFEGRYAIEAVIGRGGFARVYRAMETNTRRKVAIKILTPRDGESSYAERVVARFEREARLLAGLKSAHSVTMYEFGRSSEGLLYLVFEYVDGATLSDLVAQHGRLEPRRVVSILEQVLTALGEAHKLGILHRDIKPANIMVYEHLGLRDLVKVLDFGIAKTMSDSETNSETLGFQDESSITTEGAVVGTPRYMAPEQIASQALNATSDIYSLGLVAYELLIGESAIGAASATGVIREQLSPTEIAFPRDTGTPAGLRRVVEKMTRKSRPQRYQSVEEVLSDLENWREPEQRSSAARFALIGLAVGALLVVGAVVSRPETRTEPAAVPTQPAPLMGDLLAKVRLDDPTLTLFWLKSSYTFELRGTRDAREIPAPARAVVAVERDLVPIPPAQRWVADLSDWDGESLDKEIWVELISDDEFHIRADAAMAGIRWGRHFGRNAVADVVGRFLEQVARPRAAPSMPDEQSQ